MLVVWIMTSVNVVGQSLVEQSVVDDMERCADEGRVAFYGKVGYDMPKNMHNVEVAYFDAREQHDEAVAPLMQRYYDAAYAAHPSVLVNYLAPSYYVIYADGRESETRLLDIFANLRTINKTARIVLLYSADELPSTDILKHVHALYYLRSGARWRFDLLTQAFWGGIEVRTNVDLPPYADALAMRTSEKIRLAYSSPMSAGLNAQVLDSIDDVMKKMIADEAAPGGVVLVARHGRVIFERTYGTTMYRNHRAVNRRDLYDIASLSKMVGTLPLVMNYNTYGIISLSDCLGDYMQLPPDKGAIRIENLLLHNSGLPAGVPAFLLCVDSTSIQGPLYSRYRRGRNTIQIEPRLYMLNNLKLKEGAFSAEKTSLYNVEITKKMYTTEAFRASLYAHIDNSKLLSARYRYSDLSFIYLQRLLETLSGTTLDVMFRSVVTEPLGLCRIGYRPLETYKQEEIIPTEDDKYFRKALVWGTVHDQTCALLGGVAGHAGLFSTAGELVKIGQLFLNGGTYGGVTLFSEEIVSRYTKRHADDNRRGYGFDKPEYRANMTSPVADNVSLSTYGHSGFSGTLMWMDPDNDLIYIFLSNRISPNAYNNKLIKNNIRSEVHRLIYNAISDCK